MRLVILIMRLHAFTVAFTAGFVLGVALAWAAMWLRGMTP